MRRSEGAELFRLDLPEYKTRLKKTCADAAAPDLTWSDRLIRPAESIFFELAGVHERYHCPLARTYYFGKPIPQILDAEKAILDGVQAGLKKALAGNHCHDVARACVGQLARYGLVKTGRSGYSIGLGYPPAWGENTAGSGRTIGRSFAQV